jgi:hypothetical protein
MSVWIVSKYRQTVPGAFDWPLKGLSNSSSVTGADVAAGGLAGAATFVAAVGLGLGAVAVALAVAAALVAGASPADAR